MSLDDPKIVTVELARTCAPSVARGRKAFHLVPESAGLEPGDIVRFVPPRSEMPCPAPAWVDPWPLGGRLFRVLYVTRSEDSPDALRDGWAVIGVDELTGRPCL